MYVIANPPKTLACYLNLMTPKDFKTHFKCILHGAMMTRTICPHKSSKKSPVTKSRVASSLLVRAKDGRLAPSFSGVPAARQPHIQRPRRILRRPRRHGSHQRCREHHHRDIRPMCSLRGHLSSKATLLQKIPRGQCSLRPRS